ncbi:hypothetical protein [Nocardia cyriacigeorgica]|uniref:hypothetical protein n=1 Tax=Nocardia cyriacigeorgica TaxID=135487 RepID=UPI002458E044|nr:hypothetical protein [Nocardia cyriacigeorgica]
MAETGAKSVATNPKTGQATVEVVKADDDRPTKAAAIAAPARPAGEGKHLWIVKLEMPKGAIASTGLTLYLSIAQQVIQAAVDLLGKGMTLLPPHLDELVRPILPAKDMGKGKAVFDYQAAVKKAEAKHLKLRSMDDQVTKTSEVVAAECNNTLRAIKHIVAGLQAKLNAYEGKGKLKAPDEARIADNISLAIEAVYEKVLSTSDLNVQMAGGGKDKPADGTPAKPGENTGGGTAGGGKPGAPGGQPTGGQAGGQSGGGGGDLLSSLLPMLGMLPMGLMPLAQMLPELLNKDEEKTKEEEGGPGAPAEGAPPADPAAQPGSPAAPTADPNAPAATATPASQPGSPGDNAQAGATPAQPVSV